MWACMRIRVCAHVHYLKDMFFNSIGRYTGSALLQENAYMLLMKTLIFVKPLFIKNWSKLVLAFVFSLILRPLESIVNTQNTDLQSHGTMYFCQMKFHGTQCLLLIWTPCWLRFEGMKTVCYMLAMYRNRIRCRVNLRIMFTARVLLWFVTSQFNPYRIEVTLFSMRKWIIYPTWTNNHNI